MLAVLMYVLHTAVLLTLLFLVSFPRFLVMRILLQRLLWPTDDDESCFCPAEVACGLNIPVAISVA
jgi:hypothetical protein